MELYSLRPWWQSQTNKALFVLFVLLALSLPLSRAGINIFGVAILIAWIVVQFKNKSFGESFKIVWQQKSLRYLYLFFGFSILSFSWGTPYDGWMGDIPKQYLYALIFPIAMLTSLTQKQVCYILGIFLVAMLISVGISYGIYLDFWQTKESLARGLPTGGQIEYQNASVIADAFDGRVDADA